MFRNYNKSAIRRTSSWLLVTVFAVTASMSSTCRCWATNPCECRQSVDFRVEGSPIECACCSCCEAAPTPSDISIGRGCSDDCQCQCKHDLTQVYPLPIRLSKVRLHHSSDSDAALATDIFNQAVAVDRHQVLTLQLSPVMHLCSLQRCIALSRFIL